MTVRELYRKTASMGWQTSFDDDENFFNAANLALSSIYAERPVEKTVGLSGKTEYDMNEETCDFYGFVPHPVKELVYKKDYAITCEGKLNVSERLKNKNITVSYYRRPGELTIDNFDLPIDIDARFDHLLILLTSYYVWLDDEPEKAGKYLEMYKEEVKKAYSAYRASDDEYVEDVKGWL